MKVINPATEEVLGQLPLANAAVTYPSLQSEMDTVLRNIWPIHSTGFYDSAIARNLLEGRDITKGRLDHYFEAAIPDFGKMVAGNPATITYPYQQNIWRKLPDVWWLLLLYLLVAAAVAAAVVYMG